MLKKILIGLGGLIAVILVAGAVLPKDFEVEREITIAKPKAAVFEYVKYMKNGHEWAPWEKADPNISTSIEGSEDGKIGAVYRWRGNKDVGVGTQTIAGMIEGDRIDYDLHFMEPFENTAKSALILTAAGETSTTVKWWMKGKSPFPFNIMCALFGGTKFIGGEFEKGLASLKTIMESKP